MNTCACVCVAKYRQKEKSTDRSDPDFHFSFRGLFGRTQDGGHAETIRQIDEKLLAINRATIPTVINVTNVDPWWLSVEPSPPPARPFKPSILRLSLLNGRHLASSSYDPGERSTVHSLTGYTESSGLRMSRQNSHMQVNSRIEPLTLCFL